MSIEPKRILIAEDEKPMAKALAMKMTKAGYVVDNAYNGEEMLAMLEKNKYDLVLMDLIMPKMDGFTALEELQKRGNAVPIIVSSNLSQEEDSKRAASLGAVDFIIKSNTPLGDIVTKVESYLK